MSEPELELKERRGLIQTGTKGIMVSCLHGKPNNVTYERPNTSKLMKMSLTGFPSLVLYFFLS